MVNKYGSHINKGDIPLLSAFLDLIKPNHGKIALIWCHLRFFELPIFRTNFHFPWRFEKSEFHCIWSLNIKFPREPITHRAWDRRTLLFSLYNSNWAQIAKNRHYALIAVRWGETHTIASRDRFRPMGARQNLALYYNVYVRISFFSFLFNAPCEYSSTTTLFSCIICLEVVSIIILRLFRPSIQIVLY